MYSEKEVEREKLTMERIKVDDHERDIIEQMWNLRQKLGKELLAEAENLVKELSQEN